MNLFKSIIVVIVLLFVAQPVFAVPPMAASMSFSGGATANSCSAAPTCGGTINWSISGGTPNSVVLDQIVNGNSSNVYSGTASSDSKSVIISQGTNTFRLTYDGNTTIFDVTGTTGPTATPTPHPIQISGLSVSTGQNHATISWNTNVATSGTIDWGTSTSYNNNINDNSSPKSTSHSLTINNLQSGTTYHYNMKSTDASGNTYNAGNQTFTTNAQNSGGSSSNSSSNPTATPTTRPTTIVTPTTTTSVLGATSAPTPTTAEDEVEATSAAILGEQIQEEITPSPTPIPTRPSYVTPITIALLVATTGVIGVLSLILQALGFLKIGFLEKIVHFFVRP